MSMVVESLGVMILFLGLSAIIVSCWKFPYNQDGYRKTLAIIMLVDILVLAVCSVIS